MKVTLLGTGTPLPSMQRFGTSTLIEAGGRRVLLDCGRGTVLRLSEIGIPIGSIDAVIFSHFHSDHYAGLPDLLMTGALPASWGGRQTQLRVSGPEGVRSVVEGLWTFTAADRKIRVADNEITEDCHQVAVTEFSEGVVFDECGLKITAIEVDHGEFVKPAFGFRVEFGGRVLVHSHDTRYSENLVRQAQGADVLIHEVAMARPETLERHSHTRTVLEHHITPREVGQVFDSVRPHLAILTHVVLMGPNPPLLEDMLAEMAETYRQPVMVAHDLMVIRLGKSISVCSAMVERG
ncbi:MBL fold metallo-hydrolase [Roseinatronobacter alkalisoli]|uniref:MBL fold metallo-hydrolase n=1 Tax=Roseinatronobacter alkalisoli TaxID=3028235 RepID=A0ABT5TAQ7_9RHOB|nr:MBL fold metallo-hydrolase [Roseinatronobacter sp. HJB301]MDD7972159.1 MBL fold metallo-hydrolase [Roseinatronobacter sp. HJB301]